MKNKSAVYRLFVYQKALERLYERGITNTYSEKIAEDVGTSASQVRKDFSIFEIFGKKRGGYNVDSLLKQLSNIIKLQGDQKIVVIGVGKIGSALLNYEKFKKEGMEIVAGFDKAPTQVKGVTIPVFAMTKLEAYIKKHNIKVAILTVPAGPARKIAEEIAKIGILGILNFSAIELGLPQNKVVVHNLDLRITLKNLFFHVENLS